MGWRGFSASVICGLSAFCSQCLQAYLTVLDAGEVAGEVFDLPGGLLADLLPRLAAAGAGLLVFGQLVNVTHDRELVQGADVPPARFDPAGRYGHINRAGTARTRRQVVGVHRLLFQGDGELQQQLPDVQLVGPRAVVPLLQAQQLDFQPQLLDL
jgi:hypothetical protein